MQNQKRGVGRPSADPEEQGKRFAETARALGCDEDEAAFRDKLRVIARQKPAGSSVPPGKNRTKPKKVAPK